MGIYASRRMSAEDRAQEKITQFVRYAMTLDLDKVREMITKQKMDPNAKDRFGMNAVHWAAYVGELECIQVLIKAGGSPNATDSNGRNALHHACRKDNDEMVRYLVTVANVDINSRSENRDTPLHKAVRSKSIKVLEVLLKLGADPNLRNELNKTPLEELEEDSAMLATTSKPTITSNLVTSARLSSRPDTYCEPIPVVVTAKPRPLDLIGLALRPVNRATRTERTDIRSFRSRRSVTDFSENTPRRNSLPGQWATPPIPKPADLYIPAPVTTKAQTPLRKNLKYAAKRVIMAMRVKNALQTPEKLELMRLMLLKHTPAPSDS